MSTQIITNFLPNAYVGVPYYIELVALGGTAPYTWSSDTPSQIPEGLTLSSGGVLSGTPINSNFISSPIEFSTKENRIIFVATDSDILDQSSNSSSITLITTRIIDSASADTVLDNIKDQDNAVPVDLFLSIISGISSESSAASVLVGKIESMNYSPISDSLTYTIS